MAKPAWKPWHEVVKLREDVRSGERSLATFAEGFRSAKADVADSATIHAVNRCGRLIA